MSARSRRKSSVPEHLKARVANAKSSEEAIALTLGWAGQALIQIGRPAQGPYRYTATLLGNALVEEAEMILPANACTTLD
jgi:hypothetical protein